MSKATGQLTPHFRITEFDCHDGSPVPSGARAALREWCVVWGEPLRERFGPVTVTSGYRTTAYNASVGGAGQSFHVYTLRYGPTARPGLGAGVAADVVPARGTPRDWQEWADASMRRNVHGIRPGRCAAVAYPRSGFIHLDTGPRRTWAG